MRLHAEGLSLLVILAVSFLGWGRGFRRIFNLERGSWPATIALGMASAVFLGGILNVLHLARPIAFIALLGLGLAQVAMLPRGILWNKPGPGRAAVLSLIAVIVAVPIGTQFPPAAFNIYDDYQKYFTHVARMLQTGTSNGGGPLSALGADTFGGQAFLQGFLGAFLPIPYINGLDAVFGLFLCLLLAELSWRRFPVAAIAVLSMLLIDPQYVNVSALYTGSALIMSALVIATDVRELSADRTVPHPIAIGLLFAALIALKTTFAPFTALFLPLAAICVAPAAGGIGKSARWAAAAWISTAVFLSPWILPHLPTLRAGLSRAAVSPAAGDPWSSWGFLFSTAELAYGESMAVYTILVIAIAGAGLAAAWTNRRRESHVRLAQHFAAAAGLALLTNYAILILLIAPRSYGTEHALRLFIPLALAAFPAVLGIASRGLREGRRWIVVCQSAAADVHLRFGAGFPVARGGPRLPCVQSRGVGWSRA